MYLKALEMQGFKSFPDKTRLAFDKPVTAIVGPNGSGKSNISDALLWVMGEQSSRTLRGGKMEDVIFGGTQKRGPVGFAEVSLIIDNSGRLFDLEDAEVVITRRYYRSGESEYYINKRAVRLRDVNELLMDTGMGREGYSIIGQGKIDEILSVKSADRREIFEEAAGISRFRHRKEESERRLERTDENLVRINDKISELELQVEPLRKQAETAKKFLLLRDELRGLEISVWSDSLEKLAETQRRLNIDYETAQREHTACSDEVERSYAESEKFAQRMREKDVEAETERGFMDAATARASERDSAAAVLRAQLESGIGEAERIRTELREQTERDGSLQSQIDEKNARVAEIEAGLRDTESKTATLLSESEELLSSSGDASRELTQLIAQENETAERLSEARARLSSLAASAQELEDRESSAASDMAESTERLEKLRAEGEKCSAALSAAREKTASQKNIISGYEKRVEARRKKSEDASDRQMRLRMEVNAVNSRIALLSEMEREYQSYSKAVKAVMQDAQRGVLKNIHGTVAELISAEDKYAVAIETALGGAMQNVIVSSEEDAKAAMNMLKRRDVGRATFMPISSMRGGTLNERGLESEQGFEGVALSLVGYAPEYAGIYAYLLGRTAVADTLDNAIRIARKYGHRFRIVTLDGQVMNSGGSMTGGSTAKNAGILSRANELKRLEEQEKLVSQSLTEADTALSESKRELAAAEYELGISKSQLRELEDKTLRLEADNNHYRLLVSAAEESLGSLRTERGGLGDRLTRIGGDIETVRAEISGCESRLRELRAKEDSVSGGQERLTEERDRVATALSLLRAESASLEAERSAVLGTVAQLSELREDLTGGRERQLSALDAIAGRTESIKAEIAEQERQYAGETAEIARRRERLSAITAEKLAIEAERAKRDREMQELNKRLLELERECARFEQKKQAAEMEEKQIVDRLWDSYELSRSAAMQQRNENENIPEAKRRIGELKRDISKLGTPNIGSIDEFERVNTRYTFLTEQRDDVEKAKNELLHIIGDITEEMRGIFEREFEAINESFKQTFLELFGGGKASLELEDPSDILNCGIEIKVQPPGKSLKTLSLLSGGEKAFVAIALYFAILKIRPTPFVIMDEIEAALDEANVLRFAEHMRRMSDKTQMIVITHRRGTMEEADVLYGVTMQEQGVSRILSIDVEEAARTINA